VSYNCISIGWLAIFNFASMATKPLLNNIVDKVTIILCFMVLLFVCSSCKNGEQVPEYSKHDWYAYYTVDGAENLIIKDGFDNLYLPSLYAYDSYGYSILPDGSDSVTHVTLESGFLAKDENSGNTISFTIVFVITDEVIIASKGENLDSRLDRLMSFFSNRTITFLSGNGNSDVYAILSITDSEGNSYRNHLYSNGEYSVILDHVVHVKEVGIIEHPDYGKVLRVVLDLETDLEDDLRSGEYNMSAKTRLYVTAPFSD
jgi:hypothetical protein